ncbi:MAG: ABC transporter ATP-binding protein [Papillibacter sp.]|nr:ABC transporter ATP-binding protein [Papillibacter sp.]
MNEKDDDKKPFRPLVQPDLTEKPGQQRRGGPPMGGRPGGPRGGPMGGMRGDKPKDFKGSMKQLIKYLMAFKWMIIIVAICSTLSTILATVNPKILAKAIDEITRGVMNLTSGGTNGVDFAYVARIILILVGLYILSMLFSYAQGFILANVSTKISYSLRNEIIKKINRLPVNFFHTLSNGEIMSRITNDVDTISQSLNMSLTQIITSVVTLLGVLIMMLTISWKLTLVAIIMLPFSGIFTALMVGISQKHFRARQKLLGTVNGYVEEVYAGQTVLKAFCGEERAIREFEYENDRLYNAFWKAEFLTGMMMPIMNFIGNIGYIAICVLGAGMCAKGTLSIGGIQAFITYVRSFNQPITQVANISSQLQSVAAAAERVFKFLNEAEEQDKDAKLKIDDHEIKGDVEFRNVHFGYDPNEIIIKDFSAKVKAGQKIAIVGPTGAGKTTMVKLLMRFHDLQSGAIYLDGHDTREFKRQDLRRVIGMVLQDTWLYNGTIMENIRYGRLDATDEEVIEAAKAAQVDFFIRTQADGYNMVLNEETSNISAGQKQLLTIARAILADTKIMILDEATSSVDTRTEILIQKAMDNLMKGRTSFIIAHRLSTIRNADLILCMKDGDIVEQGNHEELMALNGFYAQLYNSQFDRVTA